MPWLSRLFPRAPSPPLLVRFHRPGRPRPRDSERIQLRVTFSPSNAVVEQAIYLAQGVGVMPPFGAARESRFLARFEDGAYAEFCLGPAEASSGIVHEVVLSGSAAP